MRKVIKLRIDGIEADRDIAYSPESLRRDLSAALQASLAAQISGTSVQWPVSASAGVREIARQATETAVTRGALSPSGPATPESSSASPGPTTTGGTGS